MSQHHPLRSHQAQTAGHVPAIARGELADVRDVLAAVTPGGGKSLLPVTAAAPSARTVAHGIAPGRQVARATSASATRASASTQSW
ncbi:hypothetical protein D3272_13460 [Lichenibacterium ramalinae]|uniref:Uncharacterized protein n=1 Tax=Lichenibacterium ramalinae TaxID=2316527 RepID=A0A4Q2REE8_9HYPH|nr:hypothetical protein D3272_13460 [Lichenibacterium ramalinae]